MTGNSIALDTNQAIAWLNGKPGMEAWISAYTTICLPVVVIGELRFGAMKSQRSSGNVAKVESLVACCTVLEVKASTAVVYADIRLRLLKKGRPIPENDLWIAAICLDFGLPLATEDAHFCEVESLHVVSAP